MSQQQEWAQTDGLTRRSFLKAVTYVPLYPSLKRVIVVSRDTAITHKEGDLFKKARQLLLSQGFGREYVDALFSDPRMKLYPVIKRVMNNPSERLPYEKYKKVMAVEQKIRDGKWFMRKYADDLAEAEVRYGVDRHYVAAIIGVESDYGRNPGSYNPVGIFVTMIERIPHKRSFGELELVELLLFCQKYDLDPHSLKGSYSGAIGIAQFIPSLLNKLYVDGDGDGKPDPETVADGIHSAANYLKNYRGYGSGWSLGTKASPGNKNWRALLAYNNHPNYARAVSEIAEGIHL
ncbi:MAG: lytic murein transglycosylase [Thermodesulfobacteriota bacterium]